jgi:hypothetical protein
MTSSVEADRPINGGRKKKGQRSIFFGDRIKRLIWSSRCRADEFGRALRRKPDGRIKR